MRPRVPMPPLRDENGCWDAARKDGWLELPCRSTVPPPRDEEVCCEDAKNGCIWRGWLPMARCRQIERIREARTRHPPRLAGARLLVWVNNVRKKHRVVRVSTAGHQRSQQWPSGAGSRAAGGCGAAAATLACTGPICRSTVVAHSGRPHAGCVCGLRAGGEGPAKRVDRRWTGPQRAWWGDAPAAACAAARREGCRYACSAGCGLVSTHRRTPPAAQPPPPGPPPWRGCRGPAAGWRCSRVKWLRFVPPRTTLGGRGRNADHLPDCQVPTTPAQRHGLVLGIAGQTEGSTTNPRRPQTVPRLGSPQHPTLPRHAAPSAHISASRNPHCSSEVCKGRSRRGVSSRSCRPPGTQDARGWPFARPLWRLGCPSSGGRPLQRSRDRALPAGAPPRRRRRPHPQPRRWRSGVDCRRVPPVLARLGPPLTGTHNPLACAGRPPRRWRRVWRARSPTSPVSPRSGPRWRARPAAPR